MAVFPIFIFFFCLAPTFFKSKVERLGLLPLHLGMLSGGLVIPFFEDLLAPKM